MKKILSALVIVAVLISFGFYAVVYSPWFPQWALKEWLQFNHPDVKLKDFQFSQRTVEPNRISFDNLSCRLEQKGIEILLHTEGLTVQFEKSFWQPQKIDIALKKAEFSRDSLTLTELNGNLEIQNSPTKDPAALTGQWTAHALTFGNYQISNVALRVGGDTENLHLNNLTAEGYGGEITGDITLQFLSVLSYAVHLKLKSLDSKELQAISEPVFSQFEGRVTGHLNIEGQGNTIENFRSEVHLDDKGQIRAKLLSPFTQYIPATLQRSELNDLIQKDASLPVEKVHLRLKNVGQKQLSFNVDLDSSLIKLDGSTVDINLDAPIMSVLQLLQIFSQEK